MDDVGLEESMIMLFFSLLVTIYICELNRD